LVVGFLTALLLSRLLSKFLFFFQVCFAERRRARIVLRLCFSYQTLGRGTVSRHRIRTDARFKIVLVLELLKKFGGAGVGNRTAAVFLKPLAMPSLKVFKLGAFGRHALVAL